MLGIAKKSRSFDTATQLGLFVLADYKGEITARYMTSVPSLVC